MAVMLPVFSRGYAVNRRIVRLLCAAPWLLASPASWAAQFAYISNSSDNSVSVIDTATSTAIATIPVGSSPFGVVVLPTGPADVYVTNSASNTVSVINPATNAVTATVTVGSNPSGIAANPGGDVYVANADSNTVSVINPAANTVISTVPVGSSPSGIATLQGGDVYVANAASNTVSVLNPTTNTVIRTVPVGITPLGIAASPGGNVYVANSGSNTVSVIDPTTNTVITTVSVGLNPYGVGVLPFGDVYVTNYESGTVSVINSLTNTVIKTLLVGANPIGVATSPDGSIVYVANSTSNTVSVIDAALNIVVGTVPSGNGPAAFGQFIGDAEVDSGTVLVSSVNPSFFGQSTTFTATVSALPPATETPTGTVTFLDGSATICSAVMLSSGSASCAVSTLSTGPHPITATYSGDVDNQASTSNTVTQQVNQATSSLSLTTSCMTTFVENQSFTMTAFVSGVAPTGDVSVTTQDNVLICDHVPLSSGSATCTTNSLSAGSVAEQTFDLTASYGGDANNASSTSATLTVVSLNASDVVYRNSFEMDVASCPIE